MVSVDAVTLGSIVRIFLIIIAALLGYKILYLDRETKKLDRSIPASRGQPLVITKMGLCTAKKTIPLSPNKYKVEYDNPDYPSQIYYKTDLRDDLLPVDTHQHIFGTTRPVYIEYDLMLKLAYGVEDSDTRKFAKSKLVNISKKIAEKGLDKEEMDKYLSQLSIITEKITTPPENLTKIKEEYVRSENERTKLRSELLLSEQGTEGKIERRLDPVIAIAGRRASQKPEE